MSNITATAKVTLTVEISGIGSWGNDCTVEQVHKQAKQDAVGKLNRILSGSNVLITGPINVTMITTDQEKSYEQ